MKVFHLSDLHIGLKLVNHDLKEDQIYILEQIAEAARREKPEVVIIAGDIYDKAIPSAEAVDVFDRFVLSLREAVPDAEIMMISGNHDSASRVNIFRKVLCHQHIHMIGMPPQTEEEYIEKVTVRDQYGEIHFYLLPFVKPSMVKRIVGSDENGNNLSYNDSIHKLIEREAIDCDERNVLVSHQFYLPVGGDPDRIERADSEIRTVGNIDAVDGDILSLFDYAALGHIHKPMKVGSDQYRYCGTPLACSISEAGQQKGIIMADIREKGNVVTSVIPLEPLHPVRVIRGTLEEVLRQGCDDYVTVCLTDKIDFDVIDMQDRIRFAYPNVLEIRRETQTALQYDSRVILEKELDVFELCRQFLQVLDEEEEELLQDVINSVQEVS